MPDTSLEKKFLELFNNNRGKILPSKVIHSDNSKIFTKAEISTFKNLFVESILRARKKTLFHQHYIDKVTDNPTFSIMISEETNPSYYGWYESNQNYLLLFINHVYFKQITTELFETAVLHEFFHVFLTITKSPKESPILAQYQSPERFSAGAIPYYPVTDLSLQAFSEAIDIGNERLLQLLTACRDYPSALQEAHPDLYEKIEVTLRKYNPKPVHFGFTPERCNAENGCSYATRTLQKGRVAEVQLYGHTLIAQKYYEHGGQHCFAGTEGKINNTPEENKLIAAIGQLESFASKKHEEKYATYYQNRGPLAPHDVFGETIATLMELNAFLYFYPEYLLLQMENIEENQATLGLPKEKTIRAIKRQLNSMLSLLTQLNENSAEQQPETTSKNTVEKYEQQQIEAIAKQHEQRQTHMGASLALLLSSAPPFLGTCLSLALDAGEKLLSLSSDVFHEEVTQDSKQDEQYNRIGLVMGAVTITAISLYTFYSCCGKPQKTTASEENEVTKLRQ